MKIDIILTYIPRYRRGHAVDFVPPITGIHLAALTPSKHEVRVVHQQVQPVNLDTDADLVALSFFTGFAHEAFRLAAEFRRRGKLVIAGGPHATFAPHQTRQYFDSVITGEAENVWQAVLDDAEKGRLRAYYQGTPSSLRNLPTPRYELLKGRFFIPRVIQATRGCPFRCSFCSVHALNPGYRMRPVDDVMCDISFDDFPHWWQRKVVWFWDDNLTINRGYITELLTRMIPMRKWWLTQASMDIAKDEDLLRLLRRSGCIGIFFGVETFETNALKDAGKVQNRVNEYKERIAALHRYGICVMAGFIAGFDSDTPRSVETMADRLYEIGVDVPYISILTPYQGTELYEKLAGEGRLLNRDTRSYNGYNVAFRPKQMTPRELLKAHRRLWRRAFSIQHSLGRILRSVRYLRFGTLLMCVAMNLFYGLKALGNNLPAEYAEEERKPVSEPHLQAPRAANG